MRGRFGWIRHGMAVLALTWSAGAVLAQGAAPVPAQATAPGAAGSAPSGVPTRELVVGTKVAAPFAMKGPDGRWTGISIDLWREIAQRLGLRYRFVERPLAGLIDGVADRSLDAAVAAITVTADREARLDFSQPYYASGLGIAVPEAGAQSWWSLVRSVFSLTFVQAVLALGALLLFVGFLLWLAERRRNDQFGGGPAKGIGSAFWWSAVTMTTVGYGDKAPVTLAGRLIGIGWMFASVIVISSFTAGITTALTTSQLRGIVNGVRDLPLVRVGSVSGSAAGEYLAEAHIGYHGYADAAAGLEALRRGRIEAFVYDKPLLQWLVSNNEANKVRVLPQIFDKQNYAIAVPADSPLREAIDRALLAIIQGDDWSRTMRGYLESEP